MSEVATYTCTMCGYQGEFEIEGPHEIECGGCHHTICLFKVGVDIANGQDRTVIVNNLRLWDNGNDVVIAESVEDAAKVWGETTGQSWDEYLRDEDENATWSEYKPQSMTLWLEDEDDAKDIAPEGAEIKAPSEKSNWWTVTASPEQWVCKLGRSFVGSDNW